MSRNSPAALGLVTVSVAGDPVLHLAPDDDAHPDGLTLCREYVEAQRPPARLRWHGCGRCINAAQAVGLKAARGPGAVINLQRLPSAWS